MKTRSHHLRYLSEPDPVPNDFQSVPGLQIPKSQYLFHNVTELSQLGNEQRGEPIA